MEWKERDHPRDDDGKFTETNGGFRQNTSYQELKREERGNHPDLSVSPAENLSALGVNPRKKKMTPAEKIASVHIDFDKDNVLPELNEEDLAKIGVNKNKPVLLKKNIIDRNAGQHSDLTNQDFQSIIAHALYEPSEIFSANADKPYFHFAKVIEVTSHGKSEIGVALLDVDERKNNFEVVHAHFVRERSFRLLKKDK